MVVKFHGKKLVGEATTSQRVTLHFLTGEDTRNLKISKAKASLKISELSKGKYAVKSGKANLNDATVYQRALLAKLEHRTNYGEVISKADASRRISKLLK